MTEQESFRNIDRPYDDQLSRVGATSNKEGQPSFGNEQTNQYSNVSAGAGGTSVTSGNMLGDVWINTFIRSKNWKPKERGFTINGEDGYAEFSNVVITGDLAAATGTIGGFTITSDELYSTEDGNKTSLSSGPIAFSVGPEGHPTATIMQNGLASFANISVSGGSITDTLLASLRTGSMPSIQGWTSDLVFSATNNTTVEWAPGDIKLVDGTTYAIVAGNTGVMAAITYIYIDIDVSSTVLQKSSVAADSVGTDKILVAVAENNSDATSSATFQVFGGAGGQLLMVDNIAANSASTNEFVTNTAQIKDAIISTAKIGNLQVTTAKIGNLQVTTGKIVSMVANKITAGTGIINSLSILSTLTMGSAATNGIIQSYGWNGTASGFQISGGATPAFTLLGGTIRGSTFETAAAGLRLKIVNTQYVQWYNNNDQIASVGVLPGTDKLTITADGGIYVTANGAGDHVSLIAGTGGLSGTSTGTIDFNANGNFYITGDEVRVDYNDDNTNADCRWYSNNVIKMTLDQSGNVAIAGTLGCVGDFNSNANIQCGGTFESSDGSDGITNDLRGYISGIRWDGSDLQVRYTELEFKDGILTDYGSESSWYDV